MKRIAKSTVKRAWAALDRLSFEGGSPVANRLLNAAAVAGLAQRRESIAWRQALPDSTALEFEGRNVMLTFDPSASFRLVFPVSPDAEREAQAVFAEELQAPLKSSLECLALKALEPNFQWLVEPSFPELEAGSGGDAPS